MGNIKSVKDKLLLIDIVKIVAILAIVYSHLPHPNPSMLDIWIKINDKFYIGWGYIGVSLFIFASGYGLSVRDFNKSKDILKFYKIRLIRIYPAFLMAVILEVILTAPWYTNVTFSDFLKIISGFQCEFGILYGFNRVHWFIGTIILLYLIYPVINKFIKINQDITLITTILLSFFSIFFLSTAKLGENEALQNMWYWNPLSWLAYFTFGMYLSKINIIPKIHSFKTSIYLSELTFYVYLTHSRLAWNPNISDNILLFIISTVFLSHMLYSSDKLIQKIFFEKN